jgi:hypothetical protein
MDKNFKQQWFVLQYGSEKEPGFELFKHPVPHSVNRFSSHVDDAIVLAAEKMVKESGHNDVSDFSLLKKAKELLLKFDYIAVDPALIFTVEDLRLTKSESEGLYVDAQVEINQSANQFVVLRYADAMHKNSLKLQLFDVKNCSLLEIENKFKSAIDQLNNGFKISDTGPNANGVSIGNELSKLFDSMESEVLEPCHIFIHCTHNGLSTRFYEVLGADLFETLVTMDHEIKNSSESTEMNEEELPF